jgi:hypothetical protein
MNSPLTIVMVLENGRPAGPSGLFTGAKVRRPLRCAPVR